MEATESRTAERTIVELLLTWGATADPVVADLLRALGERRGVDDAAQLRAILQHADALPDDELRQSLRALLDELADGGAAGAPEFRQRYRETLERLETVMAARLTETRESLRARMEPWLTLLPAEQRDALLVPLWRSGRVEPPLGFFAAQDALADAAERLESARREMIEATLRQAESAGDGELLEQLRSAAAAADPGRIADGRRRLGRLMARSDEEARVAQTREARERLLAACGAAREKLDGPAAGADPVLRGLLTRAVEAAETAAEGEEAAPPEPLERWRETVETFTEAIGEGPASSDSRLRLARGMAEEIDRLPGEAREPREAARDLEAAAGEGGAPYYETLQRCCALLQQARAAREQADQGAAEALRESAGRLSAVLGRAAGELPTSRVVQARLTIEQVEELIAAGDPGEMETLAGSLRKQTEEIEAAAAKLRKVRHSRTEAGRARVREEAERLLELAPTGVRRKLEELSRVAEEADSGELGALGTKARGLNRAIERGVRRDAVLVLQSAAGREKRGKLQPGARKLLDELRGALKRDDLARASELARDLAGQVGRPSRLRGPLAWGLGAAGLVLLVAAALVGWRFLGDRPQPYLLMLEGGTTAPAEVTVTLYQEGQPVDERRCDPAEGVTFRLRPGRYEVMVNDRYTGRVVHVPDDPSPVEGIPVPPATGELSAGAAGPGREGGVRWQTLTEPAWRR